jgi:hypothetical protein
MSKLIVILSLLCLSTLTAHAQTRPPEADAYFQGFIGLWQGRTKLSIRSNTCKFTSGGAPTTGRRGFNVIPLQRATDQIDEDGYGIHEARYWDGTGKVHNVTAVQDPEAPGYNELSINYDNVKIPTATRGLKCTLRQYGSLTLKDPAATHGSYTKITNVFCPGRGHLCSWVMRGRMRKTALPAGMVASY